MTNAVASSSKRPAPSSSTSPTGNKAKKPRPSTSSTEDQHDDDDEEEELEQGGEMDEDMKAKIARKEARTIRNRESAQRSRNQRKAHLVYLEQRVVELEAENRALKGDSPPTATPPSSFSVGRETSPAQSVISLANDLGIPSELVNGTGVKLSNVAPPPADLDIELEDVKPVIHHTPSPVPEQQPQPAAQLPPVSLTTETNEVTHLKAENAALRERVSLLENLVKQVVAVANFSGLQSSSSTTQDIKPSVTVVEQQPADLVSPTTSNMIDWSSFISAPVVIPPPTAGLDSTLSPPLYPSTITDIAPSSQSQPQLLNGNELVSNVSNPVARHPAEVATMSSASSDEEEHKALQRARGNHSIHSDNNSTTNNNLITEERIRLVSRLVIALAQRRGWITPQSSMVTYPATCGMVKANKYLGKMESTR
ncbi:hypothetical protein I302_100582 [Kwoniella bestiolae CBS 10118]|uniref:BZIP domain-containing protein n=1 Tax=Kwoniella bestiolae CBS 10118 TaxID=1296100 RepID=A0A1B9G5H1_9TREE|nr:hypothetical protein I302_03957 [Kwoniella bestiolae CBS 10118]OCF26275.1 hypothetical protein I302_03957 [Kwoniella bestiolae CBS 10118]